MKFYTDPQVDIYLGDIREVLNEIPEHSVDCIITSPPYYGLRSYSAPKSIWDVTNPNCQHVWGSEIETGDIRFRGVGSIVGNNRNPNISAKKALSSFCLKCNAWQGVLGSEPSIQLYIKHLVDIFELTKRVLKPTGSLWVNLSDSMSGGKGQSGSRESDFQEGRFERGESLNKGYTSIGGAGITKPTDGKIGIPAKSLCGVPERFVIGMIDSGWILRSKIVWKKDSTMPESADDRFTRDWEPFFFFTLTNKTHWWVNQKTKVMVGKQPKGKVEGEDWHWIACPRCSKPQSGPNTAENNAEPYQQNNPHMLRLESKTPTGCKQCGGAGRVQKNYWSGMDYFFERQFEPLTDAYMERAKYPRNPVVAWNEDPKRYLASYLNKYTELTVNPLGRNMRCVWNPEETMINLACTRSASTSEAKIDGVSSQLSIPESLYYSLLAEATNEKGSIWVINPEPQPASKKKGEVRHYAAFPTKLCTIPILACVPEQICTKCGLPRVKIYDRTILEELDDHAYCGEGQLRSNGTEGGQGIQHSTLGGQQDKVEVKEIGLSDCQCHAPFVSGIVADIFGGTGTTAVEARNLGRRAVLIDVSESYCKLAKARLEKIALPLEMNK